VKHRFTSKGVPCVEDKIPTQFSEREMITNKCWEIFRKKIWSVFSSLPAPKLREINRPVQRESLQLRGGSCIIHTAWNVSLVNLKHTVKKYFWVK